MLLLNGETELATSWRPQFYFLPGNKCNMVINSAHRNARTQLVFLFFFSQVVLCAFKTYGGREEREI